MLAVNFVFDYGGEWAIGVTSSLHPARAAWHDCDNNLVLQLNVSRHLASPIQTQNVRRVRRAKLDMLLVVDEYSME